MDDLANNRKLDHLRIIQEDAETDRRAGHFDQLHLRHRALPELDLRQVDPSTVVLGKRLSFPLLISAMTGGDHELLRRINQNLAIAAEATGIALAVGSQRVMFAHPEARASFALRAYAPHTLLFANLGAVQLNYGFTLQHCRDAVAAVGADALYLHLNPLQEAVQPEGDTNFADLAARLGEVATQLEVPLVLKEVGAGISPEDAELALRQGIRYLDVAGADGTSWSRIEHARKTAQGGAPLGLVFQDWGIPTPLALRLLKPYRGQLELFASGGLRTGIDMAKAVILGARLCGLAQPFLRPAMDSADAVIRAIHELRQEFITALFLLGRPTVASLYGDETLLLP